MYSACRREAAPGSWFELGAAFRTTISTRSEINSPPRLTPLYLSEHAFVRRHHLRRRAPSDRGECADLALSTEACLSVEAEVH